ncbi:MAG: TadE/TadG family type IV pilus assembly protein [Allosphingosinicella sp.]|uniref:TadE/TadG family type IV pilus assembly protein n=1 Tax=Allosphingosinicella sp. TaxID=2823234 RepID=UPI00395B1876
MIGTARQLRQDKRGASAIEFALVVPFLVAIIVGVAQMGRVYLADAGLRNLVADTARFASVDPRPSDDAIRARLRTGGFGLESGVLGEPQLTSGAENGANWIEITMTYTLQLDFIFWRPAPTQLVEQRRAYVYPPAA